jgi:hypothetical protein
LDARWTRKIVIGAMIPQERGLKGLSIFIFYLPIMVLIKKSGYMIFLGENPCGF